MGVVITVMKFIAALPQLWAIYKEVAHAVKIKEEEKRERAHEKAYKKLKDTFGKTPEPSAPKEVKEKLKKEKEKAADDYLDSI